MEGDRITIQGEHDGDWNRVIVEDNGPGLNQEQLTQLLKQLEQPMTDDVGCGTWNIHHRLFYQFGEGSGLAFQLGKEGGMKAVLTWKREKQQETLPAAQEKTV
jgi:two-component system sensor histidine kinase YesM